MFAPHEKTIQKSIQEIEQEKKRYLAKFENAKRLQKHNNVVRCHMMVVDIARCSLIV